MIGFEVGDEFLEVVGGEILSRDEDQWLFRNQANRREIRKAFIAWALVHV